MEYIVDVQYIMNGEETAIKELALISTDGEIYDLHLFLPFFNSHQISKNLKIQIQWFERYGLFWSCGYKEYSEIKDVFKRIEISGKVYVKGIQKQKLISQLLSEFDVEVINIEELGCPKLSVLLKQQGYVNFLKPCSLNYSPHSCAYINANTLQSWWNMEKRFVNERIGNINSAIKEWNERGFMMNEDKVKYLPKQFIINNVVYLECIYDKLPPYLKNDPEIVENMRCKKHYQFSGGDDEIDGPVIKRKYCCFCRNGVTEKKKRNESVNAVST